MMSALLLWWVVGCTNAPEPESKVDQIETLSSEDAWARIRERLLDGRGCFRRTKEYCVEEGGVVDSHIQEQLDRLFDGQMPQRVRDVGEVERKALHAYGVWTRSAEGAPLVEQRVRAYYDAPESTVYEGKGVSLRLGVLPGTLRSVPGDIEGKRRLALETPLAKDGQIASTELARQMRKALEAHPDQPAVRLAVQVPNGDDAFRLMDYRYTVESGQLEVRDGDETEHVWQMRVADWAAVEDGSVTLGLDAMKRCALSSDGTVTCGASEDP